MPKFTQIMHNMTLKNKTFVELAKYLEGKYKCKTAYKRIIDSCKFRFENISFTV